MNKVFTDSLIKNRQGEIWEMVSLSDKNIYTGSATVANQLIAHLMTVIDSTDVCDGELEGNANDLWYFIPNI